VVDIVGVKSLLDTRKTVDDHVAKDLDGLGLIALVSEIEGGGVWFEMTESTFLKQEHREFGLSGVEIVDDHEILVDLWLKGSKEGEIPNIKALF